VRDSVLKINRVFYSIREEETVEPSFDAASGRADKVVITIFFHQHAKIPDNRI
jgi:hypothetical protein